MSAALPAIQGVNTHYPPLFVVPGVSVTTGSAAILLALGVYKAMEKSLPPKIVPRLLMLLLSLFALQEIRLDQRMIEDFSAITGGKLFDDFIHFLSISSTKNAPVLQMFHGFGASSLSFFHVIDYFEKTTNMIAADMTGFGFSIRGKFRALNDYAYSPLWSAIISNQIVESKFVKTSKHVILGHSLGSATAIAAALLRARNDNTFTLVLEDPALTLSKNDGSMDSAALLTAVSEAGEKTLQNAAKGRSIFRFLSPLFWVKLPFSLLLRLVIRRLTHWDSFWVNALKLAFYDPSLNVDPGPVGYKLPSQAKGFDWQFVDFVFSKIPTPKNAFGSPFWVKSVTVKGALKALVDRGVRVVIVHGVNDKVISIASSRQIAAAVPGIQLIEVDRCGHIPHEERPEVFNKILDGILKGK